MEKQTDFRAGAENVQDEPGALLSEEVQKTYTHTYTHTQS